VYDPAEIVNRYIALWHEPDPARRRAAVAAFWRPDGACLSASIEARGYEELEARVARAHQRWVVDEGCLFRARGEVAGHHGAVKFAWEMVPREGGEVISLGRDFFLVDDDGRVHVVYQFVEP
jgi:hypothetical protein